MQEQYCEWYEKSTRDLHEYESNQCRKNGIECAECNMCQYIETDDEDTETYVDEENPEYYTVRKERGNEK